MEINKKIEIIGLTAEQSVSLPIESGKTVYTLDFSSQLDNESDDVFGTIRFPIIGFSYFWHPTREYDYTLPTEWAAPIRTKINYSMPIFTFFDGSGKSKRTIAFSEIIHEVVTTFGVNEETATIEFSIQVKKSALRNSTFYMYVLDQSLTFSQAVKEARRWVYTINKQELMNVPIKTKKNVYSTWYSFHQKVSSKKLEIEAEQFPKYELQTLIVDDGWQTEDASRRYSYAGDWDISLKKFPEMKQSIVEMQEKGINYLLWISLPYIGIKSKHWEEFKEKFLYVDEFQKAGVLDPRYPEVRSYLIDKTIELVRKLNLDGVKIDFLDVFEEREVVNFSEGWDQINLEEAIQQFLTDLILGLQQLNEEIMIEFREDYFGPFMNGVGNIFRVKDCPNNYVRNRVGIAKLRLLCPKAAIHSDMIMWHPEENLSFAAKQLLNCLFSVPQISLKLSELSKEQQEMLNYWLTYIQVNQSVLLEGEFEAFYPQEQFTQLVSYNAEKTIIAIYGNNQWIELDRFTTPKIDIVNASESSILLFRAEKSKDVEIIVRDCKGIVLEKSNRRLLVGVTELTIPVSGLIQIREVEEL